MAGETILRLTGADLPPYAARGLKETLSHLDGDMQRTINGTLVNLTATQMRKYKVSIEGSDQMPPSLENVWPGAVLVVDCISELCQVGDTEGSLPETDADFGRDFVPGSVRAEAGFTFYRPRLTCMLISFSVDKDEYAAKVGWQLELEEV